MPIHRTRISQRVKDKHRQAIKNVIKGLSRKVMVYLQPKKLECPNCYYDKLTDSSTGKCSCTPVEAIDKQAKFEADNPGTIEIRYKYFKHGRCPVCHGKGYLEVQRRTWMDALVTWDPQSNAGNQMTFTPAGTEGSTIVVLKTDPKYFDLVKNCKKLVVDGVECKISKPPILRGLGTQSVLIVTAFTTEKPSVDSSEFIKDYS
jgi:hypothetical protein